MQNCYFSFFIMHFYSLFVDYRDHLLWLLHAEMKQIVTHISPHPFKIKRLQDGSSQIQPNFLGGGVHMQ